MSSLHRARVGTAAWTIPKESSPVFIGEGTHLERYAEILNAVEINSSFYRDHQPETYRRWRESVPEDFRFAVKLSRYFTHEKRLRETDHLCEVLAAIAELQAKLGVILVQIPPSLEFSPELESFWSGLRRRFLGHIAFEPRHPTWDSVEARALLKNYAIRRVWADPDPVPRTERDEESDFDYFRLHGSPEIYRSDYDTEALEFWLARVRATASVRETWCIFDNTTFGHATRNALWMHERFIQNDG